MRAKPTSPSPPPVPSPLYAAGAAFCALFAYFLTLYPTLGGGDSGELTLVAQTWGTAHPPGYPLFTMLGHLASLVPAGTVAARVNALSAFADAGAVFLLTLAVGRWTRRGAAALAAGLAFAFSPLVWRYATVAEVFALNNLFVAGLLYAAILYRESGRREVAYAGALWIGLGLSNHHSFAFLALPAAVGVALQGRRDLGGKGLALSAALALAGLLPYLSLPLISAGGTTVAWGDQSTWDGFWTHFLRREYGTLSLASAQVASAAAGGEAGGALGRIGAYLATLPGETLGVGWLIALLGIRESLRGGRRDRRWAAGLLAAFVFYVVVFSGLSNLPLRIPLYFTIQSRFWQLPNVLVFFWMGGGLAALATRPSLARRGWPAPLLALAVGALQLGLHYRGEDQSRNRTFEEFARATLALLPERALVMTSGDTVTFPLRYFQHNEGLAPQARLLDLSLLSYPWSRRTAGRSAPDVVFPGTHLHASLPGAYPFKAFLDANAAQRPLVVVNGLPLADPRYQDAYSAWPVGLVEVLLPKGQEMALEAWRRNSEQMWAQTPYDRWKDFEPGTWEHELYRLALTQRYRYGLKLLFYAGQHGNDPAVARLAADQLEEVAASPVLTRKPELFIKPYRLYRHLGLAYQMVGAREKMTEAWRKFLRAAAPDEEDAAAIRAAVGP